MYITCRTCNEEKHCSEFPFQKKYGFRGDAPGCYRKDCKECTASAAREYRKTYVKKSAYRTDVDKLLYSAVSCRVGDAKMRTKKHGGAFDIDTDYMYDLLLEQNKLCALTGVEMTLDKNTMNVLSIDKKLPELGYAKGNVQWVGWAANRAKGDLSMGNFVSMCNSVVRCNDYLEREYSQVAGSALPERDDIV